MISLSYILVPLCAVTATLAEASTDQDFLSKILPLVHDPNMNSTLVGKWENLEKTLKNITNTVIDMALPRVMESSISLKISAQCMRDGLYLMSGLRNIRPWAMRFLDSSGKVMDGMLMGTISSFGAYDECVDTVVKSIRSRDKGKVLFNGQYCILDFTPPLPPKPNLYKMENVLDELKNFSKGDTVIAEASKFAQLFYLFKFRYGICVPSGCSIEDLDKIANAVGSMLSLSASASRCEIKKETEFSPLIIAVITCYSFAGFLMLCGSLIDLYAYYRKVIYRSIVIRVLTAFSFFTNFKKFVDTETSSDQLSCLNGIRFLCMTWIIVGHTYFTMNFQLLLEMVKIREIGRGFAFQAVANGSVAVETFFCIGGLLVCYVTIKHVRQEGHQFSISLYIVHRLWRILPVYAYVIMFMFLGNLTSSGPIWYHTDHNYLQACYDNWWTNLLFINNFYDAEHMCIPHSWYIASDFQMYVGALIIILPMLRWPRVGILLSILAIVASVVYAGLGTYINGYPPTLLFANPDPEQRTDYMAHYCFRPFVHVGPYCIGILSGYLLATKPNIKIPPVFQVIGWSLAFVFNFSVLYGVVEWNRSVEPTFWGGLLYAALHRVAWTLGVAWMIVCCSTGQGSVINYILSWKAFIPLGRLTYVAYLIHCLVQISYVGNMRTLVQTYQFIAVWMFFGHLCVTYGAAFAGSMLIESPFMSLEKILLRRNEKKTDNSSPVRKNSIPKGTLKNGDSVVQNIDKESAGIDNICAIYKL